MLYKNHNHKQIMPLALAKIIEYIDKYSKRLFLERLIKTKERVSEHGEVFTPNHIVLEMISLIDDSTWSDKEYIALEPTCGNGNFVVEIIKKKISCGLTIYQAVNTTFGMDIQDDNIFECRVRVLKICMDYENDSKKLFELSCLIVNNFFVVNDSLSFIQDKKWEDKKFFSEDPTIKFVETGLKKHFKKPTTLQTLSTNEQLEIKNQTKIFLKKAKDEI